MAAVKAGNIDEGGDSKDKTWFRYDGVLLFPLPDKLLKGKDQIEELKKLKQTELRADDVIICAYPKCGTHWLWEVLGMLIGGVIQYQQANKRTRMMEFIFKEATEAIPSPRILNTHLPLRMLPTQVIEKGIKCIHVKRNPKDACVSLFHHLNNARKTKEADKKLPKSFSEFIEVFLLGEIPYNPYHEYLNTWRTEVAEAKTLPTLELYYEDMKRDPVTCVQKIADFLDLKVTSEFCRDVAEACSFQKMKNADEENSETFNNEVWKEGSGGTFYRKGEVGDWKNWFTVAESERFDQIWKEKTKDLGISFTYSLK